MENPLELPAPNDPIERIHVFARDLAYGAAYSLWTAHVRIRFNVDQIDSVKWETGIGDEALKKYIENKWLSHPPSYQLLLAFEYIGQYYGGTTYDFTVTQKAFDLLKKPFTAPTVFISYKREYSSALALLVEAKLKLRDSNIGIFIDKLIKPGDDWEQNIREKIKEGRYFICLLAPDTYTESEWVRKELEWAYEAGCEIISVFHGSAKLTDRYPVWLGKKQIIKVDFETAKHYESALDEILVGLGYSTY